MPEPLHVLRANKWRAAYNPLRGLTLQRAVSLLEGGEQGMFADLAWAFRFIEKRNHTLRAVKRRRLAALVKLDWNIKVVDELPEGSTQAQADAQAKTLRAAYEAVDNLKAALRFLALAEFRGYAHLEKHRGKDGAVTHLEPVPQWHWCRADLYSPWQYNADARQSNRGEPVEPADFIIREVDDPIDEIALVCFIRQNLSQKDWDGFIETYGIPPLFAEMPATVPQGQEKEYQAMAEAVIADFRGTLPNGAKIQSVDSASRGVNPFRDHLKYQDEIIVLAGTGGKLTMLAEPGSGTLAGNAHADTFDEIAEAEAMEISEIFQAQFDKAVLAARHPGQPALAYFELAAQNVEDLGQFAERLAKLKTAGFTADAAEVGEKFGLKLTATAAPALPDGRAPGDDPEAAPFQNRRPWWRLFNRAAEEAADTGALTAAFARDHADAAAALDKLLAGDLSDAELTALRARLPELWRSAQQGGATAAELEKIFGTAAVQGLAQGAQARADTLRNRLRRAWRLLTR